jgi:hypothetical protein
VASASSQTDPLVDDAGAVVKPKAAPVKPTTIEHLNLRPTHAPHRLRRKQRNWRAW